MAIKIDAFKSRSQLYYASQLSAANSAQGVKLLITQLTSQSVPLTYVTQGLDDLVIYDGNYTNQSAALNVNTGAGKDRLFIGAGALNGSCKNYSIFNDLAADIRGHRRALYRHWASRRRRDLFSRIMRGPQCGRGNVVGR